MIEDLRGKMARGVVWMVLLRLLDRGIGFLSTLVLARLLTPDNFGIVAMATSLIAMLELIAAFGFDMALIQRTKPTRAHYDTAWTFTVILGCILSVLLVGLSWPVAWFYGRPELLHVIWALAFGSLVQGFQNIGTVAFRKDMEFHKEFRFVASKRLVTVPITITLAYLLRNYWALVAGMVAGRVVDVWLSYRFHPHRPRFDLSATADLLHFSKWLLLVNALQFLRDRSPDFIIGRIAGPHELADFRDTADILDAVGCGEAEVAGEPVAHVVAVQQVGVMTERVELPFHQVGDGRLTGAGQPGEPHDARALAFLRGAGVLVDVKRLPVHVVRAAKGEVEHSGGDRVSGHAVNQDEAA